MMRIKCVAAGLVVVVLENPKVKEAKFDFNAYIRKRGAILMRV
jgi:hypothetical protein